jgi:hypothetical protein
MEPSDFRLDVRLAAAGPAVTRTSSEDCTSDGCGLDMITVVVPADAKALRLP